MQDGKQQQQQQQQYSQAKAGEKSSALILTCYCSLHDVEGMSSCGVFGGVLLKDRGFGRVNRWLICEIPVAAL